MSLVISSHWRVICPQKCWCPTGNDWCPPVAASWRRLCTKPGLDIVCLRTNYQSKNKCVVYQHNN